MVEWLPIEFGGKQRAVLIKNKKIILRKPDWRDLVDVVEHNNMTGSIYILRKTTDINLPDKIIKGKKSKILVGKYVSGIEKT